MRSPCYVGEDKKEIDARKRPLPERDRCQKEIVTQFAFLLWVKLFQKVFHAPQYKKHRTLLLG